MLEGMTRLWRRRGWLRVYAIRVRIEVEDAARAALTWVRSIVALDQLTAEYVLARSTITREYRRQLAAIDIDVAIACAQALALGIDLSADQRTL